MLGLVIVVVTLLTAIGSFVVYKQIKVIDSHPKKRSRSISILKPIKGSDEFNLSSNIESFFRLSFVDGDELIFCFETENDLAINIVKRLENRYPKTPVKIMTGAVSIGVNPKIQNIWQGYNIAKNDLILISDCNVEAEEFYLEYLDNEFAPGVGILTAVIRGSNATSLAGKIESIMLHKFYNKWIVLLNAINHPAVAGQSLLFSRTAVNKVGGLEYLSLYLAEDYVMGLMMKTLGLKTRVMSRPISCPIGNRSFSEVIARHVRWGRTRKAHAPLAFILEPLTSLSVLSVIAPFVLLWWQCLVLIGFIVCCEIQMIKRVGGKMDFVAYVVNECLVLPVWLYTLCGNTVSWRNIKFKMLPGGTCTKI